MDDVLIIEAARTPIGRRNGSLASVHPIDLLGRVQAAALDQARVDPGHVEQVVGGCVDQVGEQAFNITRTAWLAAGLPVSTPSTSVDAQCGSSQQATTLAAGLVAGGIADVVVACGVESMTRVPMAANVKNGPGKAINRSYFDRFEFITQHEAAERLAERYDLTREALDQLGLASQERAAAAWAEGRYDSQIVAVEAPVLDDDGKPTGTFETVTSDGGLRPTTLESLAALKTVAREDGYHTAGTSSQISDGAAAVLLSSAGRAQELDLTPRARIVGSTIVGSDPVVTLTGPIDATRRLLKRVGLGIDDMDVVEINEAFASVVLAWNAELGADPALVNPNGGAIALGHPLGATGAILVTKALHELERIDGRYGLVTMCCAGGLGTATVIERV